MYFPIPMQIPLSNPTSYVTTVPTQKPVQKQLSGLAPVTAKSHSGKPKNIANNKKECILIDSD